MKKEPESQGLKTAHPIELIIFDCDGVLVDSEVISIDILLAELRAIDVSISEEDFYQHFLGRSFAQVKDKIYNIYNVLLAADFESNYQQRLLQAFETRLQPTLGIRYVLEQLGTAYCVATSSSPNRTKRALALTGLSDFFTDNVFTASQVKQGKPAPDLFLFAANQMGVKPEHCLVIEDSLVGLQAAQAAGMLVWHYLGGRHMTLTKPMMPEKNSIDEQIPSITRFRSWQKFYSMATDLKQTN